MATPLQTFGDVLAGTFGNPVDRAGASLEGMDMGSQMKLRSANTESAMEQARQRRAAAVLDELTAAARQAARENPSVLAGLGTRDPASMVAAMDAGWGNIDQTTQAAGNLQSQTFADLVADPGADPRRVAATRAAMAPGSYHQQRVEGGMLLDDVTNSPTVTPVGQAQIANYGEQSKGAGTVGSPLLKTSNGVLVKSTDGGATWSVALDPTVAAGQAAQVSAARNAGAAVGQKQASLESNLNAIEQMNQSAVQLLTHPGFEGIYGMKGVFPNMPGGQAAGAESVRNRLNSQGFLSSIASMKNMGSLSNAEGLKVESALSRVNDARIGSAEARTALGELQVSLASLARVARAEANSLPSQLGTPNNQPGTDPAAFVPAQAQQSAPPAALQYLQANPSALPAFVAKYGYDPTVQ